MFRWARQFWKDDRAAVAPTIALALAALIGLGGLAFDYARMAGMETELQNAADQAALAAASQLDGQDGARSRATQAAQDLVANLTYFANDDEGTAIDVPSVIFYSDYNSATGAKGPVAGADEEANYVLVTVDARVANYALTPIIAAFSSGEMAASAFAGLSSAICNTPPVMICNPAEPEDNTILDYAFDAESYHGYGIKLISGNATTPGNFGFLETDFGNGANNLARALGYNNPPGECVATDGVTTKPGLNAAALAAFNTRFDITENVNNSCPGGGPCSPSINVRKDLVHAANGNNCGIASGVGGQGWRQSPNPYLPASNSPLTSNYPDVMGQPRDICHAVSMDGVCTAAEGRIGDGVWDRNAYFQVNYGWNNATWKANTGLGDNATRYDVYRWEMDNTQYLAERQIGTQRAHASPVCRPPGVVPGPTVPDRRRISAAVINCEALRLNGSEPDVPVLHWVDFFMVEPAFNRTRTRNTEIYVEVIGETTAGSSGSTAGQVVRRDVPRLIE